MGKLATKNKSSVKVATRSKGTRAPLAASTDKPAPFKVIPLGKQTRAADKANKNKVRAPDIDETPIGASGTQIFGGMYNLIDPMEYANNLRGENALKTFNKMARSDAQVAQVIKILKIPLTDAKWSIEQPGDKETKDKATPQEVEATKWLNDVWFNGQFKWAYSLKRILEMFAYGFSCFEKVYRYDGKYIIPVKLAERRQDTIVSWNIKNEFLESVVQQIKAGNTARQVTIPAEKLVLFVNDQAGDDYRGTSVLRPAYKHFFYKDTYYVVQGVQMERWAIGVPKISQTEDLQDKSGKQEAINATKNIRANEKGYVMEPLGWKIDLMDAGQAKMLDLMAPIKHHNQEILKAVLAQFLELGMTESGARSVGETHYGLFLKTVTAVGDQICDVVNENIFKELIAWNFGPNVRPPRLTYDGVKPNELQLLAQAYMNLSSSKFVTPDDKLEAYVRKQAGLPPVDETSRRTTVGGLLPTSPTGEETPPKKMPTQEPQETSKPKTTASRPSPSDTRKGRSELEARHTCDHPHHKNADSNYEQPMSFYFWRPLRATEEHIPWRSIVAYLDESKERIVKLTRESREKVVDELNKQVATAFNETKDWRAIDYSDEQQGALADAIFEVLSRLVSYGQDQVKDELETKPIKLTAATKKTYEELLKERLKFLRDRADNSAEISLDKLVDAARAYASSAIRTGSFDPVASREALEDASENVVRKAANYNVTEAFNAGRTIQAELDSNKVLYAEYSAIMDQNTCGPCSQLDGKQFFLDDPEYAQNTPPLADCEGGTQCRCIWVYVTEVTKPKE